MAKKLIVEANLYSVIWRYDAPHGNFREKRRILALDAENAIDATRPLALYGAKLVKAEILGEGIEILVTKEVWKAAYSDGNLPYQDEDVRELLKQKYINH